MYSGSTITCYVMDVVITVLYSSFMHHKQILHIPLVNMHKKPKNIIICMQYVAIFPNLIKLCIYIS